MMKVNRDKIKRATEIRHFCNQYRKDDVIYFLIMALVYDDSKFVNECITEFNKQYPKGGKK